jgi:hypothetical protein
MATIEETARMLLQGDVNSHRWSVEGPEYDRMCLDCGVTLSAVLVGVAGACKRPTPKPEENIIPFKRPDGMCGDGTVLEPDHILEAAKGDYLQVVIVGFDKDGKIDMRSSHGSRDAMWILQRGVHHLLFDTQ